MNKKFPTQECPLCGKVLKLHIVAQVHVYSCPTQSDLVNKSHYEVEYDNQMAMQHMIVSSYSIDTEGNNTRSRIYKYSSNKWNFFLEVPRIKANTEKELRAHLNLLTPSV